MYLTAKSEKKKMVAGLLVPTTLTAMIAVIAEPLEFTFLFAASVLFVVHIVLVATLSSTALMVTLVVI